MCEVEEHLLGHMMRGYMLQSMRGQKSNWIMQRYWLRVFSKRQKRTLKRRPKAGLVSTTFSLKERYTSTHHRQHLRRPSTSSSTHLAIHHILNMPHLHTGTLHKVDHLMATLLLHHLDMDLQVLATHLRAVQDIRPRPVLAIPLLLQVLATHLHLVVVTHLRRALGHSRLITMYLPHLARKHLRQLGTRTNLCMVMGQMSGQPSLRRGGSRRQHTSRQVPNRNKRQLLRLLQGPILPLLLLAHTPLLPPPTKGQPKKHEVKSKARRKRERSN
mmetsp:Transcript_1042/g.2213  ORF Transcript_1042/g.2213 Transcript_1042/m.2213 type:complete len:272 (-) Transcript_1042:598-1413(-)